MNHFLFSILWFFSEHIFIIYVLFFLLFLWESFLSLSRYIYGKILIFIAAFLAWYGFLNWEILYFVFLSSWVLWSNIAYVTGKKYGNTLLSKENHFSHILQKYFSKKYIQKTQKYIEKYNGFSLFSSYFTWNFSGISPLIAGLKWFSYRRFFLLNSAGIFGSISLIFITGYLFGDHFPHIFANTMLYITLISFIGVMLGVSYYYIKKLVFKNSQQKRRFLSAFARHIFFYTGILICIYTLFLYGVFFIFDRENNEEKLMNFPYSVQDIAQLNAWFSPYIYYPHSSKVVQLVNIVIISKIPLEDIFSQINWIENISFYHKSISAKTYLSLLRQKELPVSLLTFNGYVQNSAFQEKSDSNFRRTHVRFWNYGVLWDKYVYIGSISEDTELELSLYNYFITPIHEISPNLSSSSWRTRKSNSICIPYCKFFL